MATKEQIKWRALNKLGVIANGQTMTAAQDADMEAAYLETYGRLADIDAVGWDADEDVPDSVANEVAVLVAMQRVDNYSISNERLQRLASQASMAEARIFHVLGPTYQSPLPVSDF
jgi:hypothetical protein